MWLRSWTNDLYLWYDEVADTDPGTYTVASYFELLKTTAKTSSGIDKDQFHFTYPSNEWYELSTNGASPGYGMTFSLSADGSTLQAVVAYIEPNSTSFTSPALAAGLSRGLTVVEVDNISLINISSEANLNTIYAGLFPANVGETHTFKFRTLAGATTASQSITSVNVISTPVQNVKTIATGSRVVGYMLFNDHIATAESQLVAGINQLISANVNELVLDVRYNGGGYLDLASELAYMIGGSATTGKTFELLQFNNKHTTTDPVTGDPLTPVDFHTTAQGFSVTRGTALPTLNLSRVFVLTGPDTCSASESIINSLRGADVEVIQIGSTTCGKPYGFYPFDNCGTTYFSIQFRGLNNKNFGDYADGFRPANSSSSAGVSVPGCSIADDFTHGLGDAQEGRLAEAIDYMTNGSCASAPSGMSAKSLKQKADLSRPLSATDGRTMKPLFLRNRIMR
jgi:C-terminal processing protease CtpA/Prc